VDLPARDVQAVALHQLAQSGDSSADGAVNILPVMKEFVISQAHLLGDALNKFDHGQPIEKTVGIQKGALN